jgi:hypothetical protein
VAQFHLEIDEIELFTLIFALGSVHQGIPTYSLPLAKRLASLANGEPAARPSQPAGMPVAVEPKTAPVTPALDNPPARFIDPEITERTFRTDSITKVGNRLVLKWKDRDAVLQASCWDAALFPALLRTVKLETTYLVKAVKKGNATYLNVVGVK